jgi:hypothetical protein
MVPRRYYIATGSLAIVAFLICLGPDPKIPEVPWKRSPITQTTATPKQMKARSAFMRASLPFERNVGQTDAAASFLSRGMGYTVFFTNRSVVLRLSDQSSKNWTRSATPTSPGPRREVIQ